MRNGNTNKKMKLIFDIITYVCGHALCRFCFCALFQTKKKETHAKNGCGVVKLSETRTHGKPTFFFAGTVFLLLIFMILHLVHVQV